LHWVGSKSITRSVSVRAETATWSNIDVVIKSD
jgi:hypothetical protein